MIQDEKIVEWRREIQDLIKESRVDAVVSVLKRFDPWVPTADSLRSTKIGIYINELRKHSNANDEIKEMAKNLVLKWKKQVAAISSTTSSTPSTAAPPKVMVERQNSISSVTSAADSPTTPTILRERSYKLDSIVPKSVGDKIRDKTIEMLYPAVGLGSDAASSVILAVTMKVEAAMFRAYGGVNDKYRAQYKTLFSSLKDKGNVRLRERVLSGDLTPDELATITSENLMPDSMKEEIKKAIQQDLHFAVSAGNNEAETDAFKCGKCGKRKCSYYQKQTRSADEPMTTFVTCLNCNHKWKFS